MKLVFALILAVVSSICGAAEINLYVDSAAAGGGDGSQSTPWNALASVTAASVGNQVAAGNTVFVNLKGGSSFATSWALPTNTFGVRSYSAGTQPIITGDSSIDASTRSDITFSNVAFTAGGTFGVRLRACSNFTFTGCRFADSAANGVLATLSSATNVAFKNCIFTNAASPNQAVLIEGTGTTFSGYFCLFSLAPAGYMVNITGGAGKWVNCTFVGAKSSQVRSTSSAEVDLVNCIFAGNNIANYNIGLEPIWSSGLVNLTNCLVMGNGKSTGLRVNGASNEVGVVWCEPGFVSSRYRSIIGTSIDDTPSWTAALPISRHLTNYGGGMTFAVSSGGGGNSYTAAITNAIREVVTNGGEIADHGRDHANMAITYGLAVKYTGTATTATLSISASNLTISINGSPDINFDLTSAPFDTLGEVITALGANYTASTFQAGSDVPLTVPSWTLTNVTAADINGVYYTNKFNRQTYVDYEMGYSKLENQAICNCTVNGLIYPSGGNDSFVWSNAVYYGYVYGRTVNNEPIGGYLLSNYQTFLMADVPLITQNSTVELRLDGGGTDATGSGLNFTSSGVVYESTNVILGSAGYFDGSTAYLTRATSADTLFNWSHGLWCLKADVWPKGLSGTQTISWVGTDSNNRIALVLNADGSVNANCSNAAVRIFNLSSAAGIVTNFGWQKISVEQRFNTVWLRINDVVSASATNTVTGRPIANPAVAYVGSGYTVSAQENFYFGIMDNVDFIGNIYWRGQSVLDQMSEEGAAAVTYAHATQFPVEAMRIFIDSTFASNSRHDWMTLSQLGNYLRTNGTLQADNVTVVRTNALTAAANYSLRSDSGAISAGNAGFLSGVASLSDLSGRNITDSGGGLLVSTIDLGAYQSGSAVISSQPLTGNLSLSGNMKLQ